MKNNKISMVSRLKKNSLHFRRLTGLSIEKFDEIMFKLKPLYEIFNLKRLERKTKTKDRKKKIGVGMQFKLSL
ncbi:MAG: hypothetical protein P1P85_03880 [Patescibacteria group bacterium]|nr:hypothetical protein [Patescibacteria group bacterium]